MYTDNGSVQLGTAEAPNSIYGLATLANSTNNPRNNAGFTEVKLNRKLAQGYYGVAAEDRDELAEWVRANVAPVQAEIDALMAAKEADPVTYARRIIIFALLSAQVNFQENLYCVRAVMRAFDTLETADDVAPLLVAPYRGYGNMRRINSWRAKAKAIESALPFLRSLTPNDMTLENVSALWGVGPKIAAFTMALWDANSAVFTLDVWMYRLTAAIMGLDTKVNVSATKVAYSLTEGDWLAWCKRQLPDLSFFAVQWTLWNGVFGWHRSHLEIIQD